MASTIKRLEEKGLIKPPRWMAPNVQYEVMMGSICYGTSNDTSDVDIYSWAIPPSEVVFPHMAGYIQGFGKQPENFEQYQLHHIKDGEKEYDITCYSIIKYFQLCMENNPNMIESLYVPQNCVLHCSPIADIVRSNRQMFLHKGAFFKYKSYGYNQLHKIRNKRDTEGKRKDLIEKYGFDTKFAAHAVRLVGYCSQILVSHDIDLQRDSEHLKAIRRGEVSEEDIYKWFNDKERELETLYTTSTLRHKPEEDRIKELLLSCLEHHYGSLSKAVINTDKNSVAIKQIREILDGLGE